MAIPALFLPSNTGIPSPATLQGFVEKWTPPVDDGDPSMALMPMEDNPDGEIVMWDELPAVEGLLPAYIPGTAPPTEGVEGLKTFAEKPLHFAKTYHVFGTEIVNRRKPGTTNQMAGEFLAMRQVRKANIHLDQRLKQQRWAVLFGSNVLDSNGVKRTINYSAIQTVSASTPWTTYASANMILDLNTWGEMFDGVSNGEVVGVVNHKTVKHMMQNAKFLTLVANKSNISPDQINSKNFPELLAKHVGNVDRIIVYKGSYFESGTQKFYVPEGKMLLYCTPPSGYPLGAYRTTPAVQNGGLNPKPGRWSVVEDKLQTKFGVWEFTLGFHGIPILYFPQCILIATLYTP